MSIELKLKRTTDMQRSMEDFNCDIEKYQNCVCLNTKDETIFFTKKDIFRMLDVLIGR